MESCSAIKKWNNALCSNIDEPRNYHTKWSKPNRETQETDDPAFMWIIFKKWTNTQNRNRPTDIEKKLVVTKRESGREYIRCLGLPYTHYYIQAK